MSPVRSILALCVAVTTAAQAAAQATRRWAVVVEMGVVRSPATGAMEDAMRDNGYDDTTPPMCLFGYCSPGSGHPASSGAEPVVFGVSLRYALTPGLQVRAVLAPTAAMGTTMGFRADPSQAFGGSYASMGVRVGSVAVAVAPVLDDVAWVEVGPALVRGDVRSAGGGPVLASGTVPGLMVGAGLNLTPRRRWTVELAARYRLAGTLGVAAFGPTGTTVDVPLSYGSLGAHVGVRF